MERKNSTWRVCFMLYIIGIVWVTIVQADTECSQSINKVYQSIDAPVKQTLFSNDDRTEIYVLTEKNTVYKSTDAGKSWQNQMRYLEGSSEIQPLFNEAGVQKLYQTNVDGHVVLLGFGYQYWTTKGGEQYTYYNSTEYIWNKFIPNEEYGDDLLLAIRMTPNCLDNCYKSIVASDDLGATWTEIRDYVYKVSWGATTTILVQSVEDSSLHTGNQEAIPLSARRLYRFDQFTSTPSKSLSSLPVLDFTVNYGELYVVLQSATATNGIALLLSHDNGDSFLTATFTDSLGDWPTVEAAYDIATSSESVTMMSVSRAGTNRNYGSVYEAFTSDAMFSPALRNVRLDLTDRSVDLHVDQGVPGIMIANTYNVSALIVEDPNIDRKLVSVISYNKGTIWTPLPCSSTNSDANEGCSLHLLTALDGSPIQTSRHQPGQIVAQGNEGSTSSTITEGEVNLYVTRDSGVSWQKIRDGRSVFQWGNFASLFIAADHAPLTTSSFSSSWNMGASWCNYTFSEDAVEVTAIEQVGGDVSVTFLLMGREAPSSTSQQGFIAFVDLTDSTMSECGSEDEAGMTNSDFETFTAECQMGSDLTYSRRKQETRCVLLNEPSDLISDVVCQCTVNDYTCAGECWEARATEDGSLECKYVCGEQQPKTEDCSTSGKTVYYESGYRLMVGDSCSGGLNLAADNVTEPCPPSESNHSPTFTWFAYICLVVFIFATLFVFALLVVIVLYHKNENFKEKITPFIPVWCTRTPGDNTLASVYAHLDDDFDVSGSVLDDDDIFGEI